MIIRSLEAPISDGDIEEIIENDLKKSPKGQFYKGLVMWWKKSFHTSTPMQILKLVRKALVGGNYNGVAGKQCFTQTQATTVVSWRVDCRNATYFFVYCLK